MFYVGKIADGYRDQGHGAQIAIGTLRKYLYSIFHLIATTIVSL